VGQLFLDGEAVQRGWVIDGKRVRTGSLSIGRLFGGPVTAAWCRVRRLELTWMTQGFAWHHAMRLDHTHVDDVGPSVYGIVLVDLAELTILIILTVLA